VGDAVLDSSAVLAIILEEPGGERAAHHLPGAKISAVNLGEVVAKLRDLGMPAETVEDILDALSLDVWPHDREAAVAAGHLRPVTRGAGLSLGDRACLALARALGLPAVTADRAWQDVAEAVGIEVELIR
jgi:ribonuclease VapC